MGGFSLVNSRVAAIELGGGTSVLARRGAMLMFTGQVSFSPVSMGGGTPGMGGGGLGGLAGAAMRGMAGEYRALMHAEGTGRVLYGYQDLHLRVVDLNGDSLTAEADRLMAYESSLQASTTFLGSDGGMSGMLRGAVTGQGLFTTMLSGYGSAVLLAHGDVLELPFTPGDPIIVDPQSYVGHTGQAQARVQMKAGWRDAVGRGSGEALQLRLEGSGVALVQASERKV